MCMSFQCLGNCFRRDAALDDLAVKPITQFPVTLDDEVRICTLAVHFLHYLMTLFHLQSYIVWKSKIMND